MCLPIWQVSQKRGDVPRPRPPLVARMQICITPTWKRSRYLHVGIFILLCRVQSRCALAFYDKDCPKGVFRVKFIARRSAPAGRFLWAHNPNGAVASSRAPACWPPDLKSGGQRAGACISARWWPKLRNENQHRPKLMPSVPNRRNKKSFEFEIAVRLHKTLSNNICTWS